MKISVLTTLLCAVSAARIAIPGNYEPTGLGGFLDKLGVRINPKLEALKEAGRAATVTLEEKAELAKARLLDEAHKLVEKAKENLRAEYGLADFNSPSEEQENDKSDEVILDFGDVMRTCDKRDCKNKYFIKETFRLIQRALKDMGVFIYEHPAASAALFIGASVLIANLLSGHGLVPVVLDLIGFGHRGPIAGSLAAYIQKISGPIDVGSTFAQLQSAAMGGKAMVEIQKMATLAFAGLSVAGGTGLLGAAKHSLGQTADFEPVEWRSWEIESRAEYSAGLASKTAQLWKPHTAESCIAYGYREYRAQVWFVPNGEDALEVCLKTPAAIKGLGFKAPLGCSDEGPKKGVVGTWYVQSNETRCMPQWSDFEDEGCMQYGRRRKFARLIGLRHQDDWNSVCESTPARVGGKEYDGPTYCEDKGVLGIYGIFDIPDAKCECYCSSV